MYRVIRTNGHNWQTCWSVILFIGMVPALDAQETPADAMKLEPVPPSRQRTRAEITFSLRVSGGDMPLRFGIRSVNKNGKESGIPANLKLDEPKGVFTWTPTESQAGEYDIILTAKDAHDREATTTVRVTVLEREITTARGPLGDLLRKWHEEGTAAGNTGDFYDNRDRGHSQLNTTPYPQLDQVSYSNEQRQQRVDWAAQTRLLPHVTFGNSSTSASVLQGGSNVRLYYTHPRGLPFLHEQYRHNNLYIYPAHHDHHPGHNGKPYYGDLFPANSPYLIASQGSSGTDQPFMRALPFTLAAFRPEVKRKLQETGLLMPTVQMIFRMSNNHLTDAKDYLTGKAHPTVFQGAWVDPLKMAQMAHDIQLETLPPLVRLNVVEEDTPVPGQDFFEIATSEKLADTPGVIARIIRGAHYTRRLVVSAEDSFDVNDNPLTYHWVVLRGDRDRIQIKPLNKNQSKVEILVPYHSRRPVVVGNLKLDSNRVDIGAFVHNGTWYSAPGFISLYSLDNEARAYTEDGKLLEIGYGVGDADLTVYNWPALFDALAAQSDSWPLKVLRQPITERQRATLVRLAEDYRAAETQRQETKDKDEANAAAKKVREILTQKREELGMSVTEFIEDLLRQPRDLPTFYLDHHVAIEALAEKAEPGKKARFESAKKKLIGLGVAERKDDGTLRLRPLRQGDAPLDRRLTTYEKNALAAFHAEILSSLLYPQFLNVTFKVNFVDQRLSTIKQWRDVYRHDRNGQVVGWTRWDGNGASEYTADGLLVLEKDDQGRAVRARTVQYQLTDPGQSRVLRPTPGNEIITYEYDGDQDNKGRAVKRDKVEEQPN